MPDSQRDPPKRKRSYPEASGDHERRDDDRDPHSRDAQRGAEYSRVDQKVYKISKNDERDRKALSDINPHASMGQNHYQKLTVAALRRESEGSITRKNLLTLLPNSEDPLYQ